MGDAGGAGGNNMNIKQAKNEVKNTVKAYLSKDAHASYGNAGNDGCDRCRYFTDPED